MNSPAVIIYTHNSFLVNFSDILQSNLKLNYPSYV